MQNAPSYVPVPLRLSQKPKMLVVLKFMSRKIVVSAHVIHHGRKANSACIGMKTNSSEYHYVDKKNLPGFWYRKPTTLNSRLPTDINYVCLENNTVHCFSQ